MAPAQAEANVFRIGFAAMASRCEVVLAACTEAEARRIASFAIDEVARIEVKYSRYRADSIVSRINAQAGADLLDCDAETLALLDHADALHRESGGLFDITSGVLRRAWNFSVPVIPDPDQLAPLLARVGWRHLVREGAKVGLARPGMEIDFGGFGKEYAADRAAAMLVAQGAHHGYVNLAGDIAVIGPKPDGSAWTFGIRHPREPGAVLATIPITRGALATSGDYERGFDLNGRRYCHILDPRTGMPVSHFQSVSVLAPLAALAGGCSTIAMLKQDEGIAFLDAAGIGYLAVDAQGTLHMKGGTA